jgi:protein involved in polysaccharide export with SLBB domain
MNSLLKLSLLFCLLSFSNFSKAQLPDDLSKIKSYQITDDQLKKYVSQSGASGLTQAEIENQIKKRGLPDAELILIRERIRLLMSANTKVAEGNFQNTINRENIDSAVQMKTPGLPTGKPPSAKLFGAELFSTSNITFEPNLKIPTPTNYVLGPSDVLVISIFGVNDAQQTVTVNLDGSVALKYLGPIYVNGLTIEEAKKRIFTLYLKIYPALRSGKSQMQITLGAIRSIKVTILGSVLRAGTYTLPSLATVYNALYTCGGPDDYGSFREIELVRQNKVIQIIDVYNYLMRGDQSQDMRLQDRDVIRIPSAKTRIVVNGEVKRDGMFEVLPGENFGTLIQFAGGFKRSAYKAKVRGERTTDKEKKLIIVPNGEFDSFIPKDGDIYNIDRILDRFENAVTISGAVFRPGGYPLEDNMKISDLIDKADGLKEDVYKKRALLYREREDQSKEITNINLNELNKNPAANIFLRKNDQLVINSIFDFQDQETVSIGGAVRKPTNYMFSDSMTLRDLIFMANGVKEDAFLGRAILTRTRVDGTSSTLSVSLDSILLGLKPDIKLEKRDALHISSIADLTNKTYVEIYGAVQIPGRIGYSDSLTLKNFILRRGGFTEDASLDNIEIARRRSFVNPNDPKAKLADILAAPLDTIELSINQLDVKLMPYDIVTVKTNPFKKAQEVVNIIGQVLYPGPYALVNREERLSALIKRAGGPLMEANINGARLRRLKVTSNIDKESIEKMSLQARDSSGLISKAIEKQYENIVINFSNAVNNPGSNADVFVQNGDEIIIPKKDDMVGVEGEVLHPIKLTYKHKSFKYYISAAGGFVSSASKSKSFIVYANGKAARTKKVLGIFRKYPHVEPGANIFVPKDNPELKNKKNAAEVMATVSAISTAAYLVIFISQQLGK